MIQAIFHRLGPLVLFVLLVAGLNGCTTMSLDDIGDPSPKIPVKLVGEMAKKGMKPDSPVLIRIFKQESELEIWKQDRTGRYALLKVYPMCRWSGKLGPKTRTGDRQAPEGFYHVSTGMMNPKSQFYLSFNLGYPNRLEAALNYTGEALMVHGACSSSGCYAMTDQGVGEIYALVHSALAGGQDSFQVQAYPFRMTVENMAANRSDPNFAFWKNLKEGYDAFEFSKQQPKVAACNRRYIFNADFDRDPTNPLAACPSFKQVVDPTLSAKVQQEDQKLTSLLDKDPPATVTAYAEGGMHSSFRELLKQNGADKLAQKISTIKYPISRPDAALADPYTGEPWKPALSRSEKGKDAD